MRLLVVFFAFLSLTKGAVTYDATTTLTSTLNLWSTASKWSNGVVPDARTDVVLDFSASTCTLNPVLVINTTAAVRSLTIHSVNNGCVTVVQVATSLTANTIILTGNAWLHLDSNVASVSCNTFTSTGALITGFGTVSANTSISLVQTEIQPGVNGGPFLNTQVTFGVIARNGVSSEAQGRDVVFSERDGVTLQNYTLCQRCYSPVQSRNGVFLGDLTFLSPATLLNTSVIHARFLSTLSPQTFLPAWKRTPVDRVLFSSLTAMGSSELWIYYNNASEIVSSINIVNWTSFSGSGMFSLTKINIITPYNRQKTCSDNMCAAGCLKDCSGTILLIPGCKKKRIGTTTGSTTSPSCAMDSGPNYIPPNTPLATPTSGSLCSGGGLSVLVGSCPTQQSGTVQPGIDPGTTGGGSGATTTNNAGTQSASVLSTGAIIGIAFGGAVFGAAVIVLAVVLAKVAKEKRLAKEFDQRREDYTREMQGEYRNTAM